MNVSRHLYHLQWPNWFNSRGRGRVYQGIFPWLITLCQLILSQCGRNDSTQPVVIEDRGMPTSSRGPTWRGKNKIMTLFVGMSYTPPSLKQKPRPFRVGMKYQAPIKYSITSPHEYTSMGDDLVALVGSRCLSSPWPGSC